MGVVSLLEAIMGTSVDLKGLEDGLSKAEQIGEKFSQALGKKITKEPTQALTDLSKLTNDELSKMAQATEKQASATKSAYAAHQVGAEQVKSSLQQQLQVTNQLILRQEAYVATLKQGTAQQIEANAALTEMKLQSRALNSEIEKIGSTANLVFGLITAVVGVALLSIEKAIHTTAEWGLEMEHLSNRMGMTTREAATLVGVMERFGVNANVGARAMQMLSTQVKQTQESLDPFATRLGKTLGTLRDSNGQLLNMGQVLDLVRQKVSSAATDSEKLQIATSLLGARIGGQLVPMLKLSNEEWARQKESVNASLGPVEKAAEQALAYKQATAGLEQAFRGMQIELGTKLLPVLTDLTNSMSSLVRWFREIKQESAALSYLNPFHWMDSITKGSLSLVMELAESLNLMPKGTAEAFKHMEEYQEAARKAALEQHKLVEEGDVENQQLELTEQNQRKLVAAVRERVSLEEKLQSLGIGGNTQIALSEALLSLDKQRADIQKHLDDTSLSAGSRLDYEKDLAKVRVETVELVSKATADMYKREELQIKAAGDFSISTEISFLQKRLADANTVGDERLKIEAELFQKQKQFAEESIKYARQLGFASVDDEISYRKQKAAELLGKGDPLGAAGEIVKARDLALKQADQVLEFTKKVRVVSLQSEIEYQTQKLQVVKGNAEEEMKILGTIADLDKQLYEKRLQFALSYTHNTIEAYRALQKATGQKTDAVSGAGESLTFAQAEREAERARFENARTLRDVGFHGGTEEARTTGTKQAQDLQKQEADMIATGKQITEGMRAQFDAAKDFLRAASGGESIRAPGGPNPTIGSMLSPTEGLSTETLARGSDIPRLDTSFTDLSIRVRDVLLSATSYVQGFSTALQTAGQKIASQFGVAYNPGLGPGGGTSNVPTQGSGILATNQQNIGPATVAPGGTPVTPTPQVGIGAVGGFGDSATLSRKFDELISLFQGLPTVIKTTLQDQAAGNAESLLGALAQVQDKRVNIQVGFDPNSGDAIVTRFVNEISQ